MSERQIYLMSAVRPRLRFTWPSMPFYETIEHIGLLYFFILARSEVGWCTLCKHTVTCEESVMLGVIVRVVLALTAAAPITISIAYIFATKDQNYRLAVVTAFACLLLGAFALQIIKMAGDSLEILPISIQKVKSADKEVIGFFVAYALPLLFKDRASLDVEAWLLAVGMLIFVLITTHSLQVNPVLGAFGYHFYEAETKDGITFLLISKRKINNVKSIGKVVQLSEYGVLEVDK